MAISATKPQATVDGSQTGIVDTSLPVTQGNLLTYDATRKMYVPTNAAALPLSSFDNDLDVISLAEVNSAIDASLVSASSNGGIIDLVSYIKTTEVMALLDAQVSPLVDYVNILNTPSMTPYATSVYVDQQVAAVVSFSGNYSDLIGIPSRFSGSYADLSNQPIIPSIVGLSTETFVTNAIANSVASISDLNDLNDVAIGNAVASTHALMYNGLTSMWENVDLTVNWASKDYVTTQLLGLQANGQIDLEGYASEFWVTQKLVERGEHFGGNYADLVNLPTLFSGNYVDLINRPYIPSIAGLATESYVNNKHAEPDIIGDRNFTHDVEFRAGIRQVATSVTTTASKRDLVFAIETTDAIETEVSFSDSTYITLSDNTTAKFTATYVATSGTVHDSFKVTGIVHKKAGVLVAIGNNSYDVTQDSISGHTGFVSVDAINDRMTVTVQGSAATTVDWVVFVELTEVTR